MKQFDAGTKKMSVSTFGSFIKLIKVQCTKTWVSQRSRVTAVLPQQLTDSATVRLRRRSLHVGACMFRARAGRSHHGLGLSRHCYGTLSQSRPMALLRLVLVA